MTNEANFAYRESEALTTDPIGLVVVLYDMLLKDLHEAIAALAGGDVERRTRAIGHSLLVLQQLQGTLDRDKGGVVAANLDRFYNFTRAKLLEGQIKASSEIFEHQVIFVASIRDAWKQVRAEQQAGSQTVSLPEASAIPTLSANTSATPAEWSA